MYDLMMLSCIRVFKRTNLGSKKRNFLKHNIVKSRKDGFGFVGIVS